MTDQSVCIILYSMSEVSQSPGLQHRILETASRLFYEQGYHATGINQIISEAQVAKASFYHHYASKEILCVAYLHKRKYDWMRRLYKHVDQYNKPKRRVLALFDFLEEWIKSVHYRGCAFLNILSEFPVSDGIIREEVKIQKTALRDYIYSLVETAMTDKIIEKDILQRANLVYLLFEGAIVESQNFRDLWPIQTARDSMRDLIA